MSARPTEDELIARYFAPLAGQAGLGLQDDAACLAPTPGHDLVVTADALVEGVHFLPDDPPASIARKALGVNVSDLAAKGAEPAGISAQPRSADGWTEDWLAAFADGLGQAARDFGCPLLGGDTVRAPGPLTLSVTALGEVPRRPHGAAHDGPARRSRSASPAPSATRPSASTCAALRPGPTAFLRTAQAASRRPLSPPPAAPRARRDPAGPRERRHGRLGRSRRRPRQDAAG